MLPRSQNTWERYPTITERFRRVIFISRVSTYEISAVRALGSALVVGRRFMDIAKMRSGRGLGVYLSLAVVPLRGNG